MKGQRIESESLVSSSLQWLNIYGSPIPRFNACVDSDQVCIVCCRDIWDFAFNDRPQVDDLIAFSTSLKWVESQVFSGLCGSPCPGILQFVLQSVFVVVPTPGFGQHSADSIADYSNPVLVSQLISTVASSVLEIVNERSGESMLSILSLCQWPFQYVPWSWHLRTLLFQDLSQILWH